MKRSFVFAFASLLVASLAACGARVDILNGDGGAGGAAASSGPGSNGVTVGSSGVGATGSGTTGAGAGTTGSGTSGTGAGTGTGAGSTGSGSTGSGTVVCAGYGDPCTQCLSTQCAAAWCDCAGNAQCLALSQCFQSCGSNMGCLEMCQAAQSGGIADLYLLGDCAASACEAQCPGNNTLDPCTKCLLQDCTAVTTACLAQPECLELYQCLGSCGKFDLTCQEACYGKLGAGTANLQAMLECSQSACPDTCK
jgi:hypothetical protein